MKLYWNNLILPLTDKTSIIPQLLFGIFTNDRIIMPLTGQQTANFFVHGTQMGLTETQRTALASQGLSVLDDFADFGKDELEQALKNMRTSIPGIPAVPAVPAIMHATTPGRILTPAILAVPAVPGIPPIIMPAKSTHRLEIASIAWHYYTDTSRSITSTNMHYNNILKNFYLEWKAISSMSKDSSQDVPCITKTNPPLRWTDTFMDYCLNTYGVRKAPLAYIIRDNVEVPYETRPALDTTTTIDPLLDGCAYGISGSVMNDLIARLSHTHPLYKTDNAKVYSALEEATRSTAYSSTVKAFSRRRDGRAAWKALVSSHAGADKWELLQKENTKWLLNTKWNGRVYSLEKFCNQHRSRFVNLEEAQNHVDFQLPTEHTRVGYLLDNIENADADLRAAIANIRQNVNNTRTGFESAIAVLLPVDPYLKQRKTFPKGNSTTGANVSSALSSAKSDQSNAGIGKTGVDLRFHTEPEYVKLNPAQKEELYQWRSSQNGKKFSSDERKKRKSTGRPTAPSGSSEKTLKSAIKSALAQEKKKQKQQSDDVLEMAQIIAEAGKTALPSALKVNSSSTTAVTDAHKVAALKLMQIKKRASATSSDIEK